MTEFEERLANNYANILAELQEQIENNDPVAQCKNFVKKREKMTTSNGDILREFRISYRPARDVSNQQNGQFIKSMSIRFSHPKSQKLANAENGKRGGRPQTDNPTAGTLRSRKYRALQTPKKNNFALQRNAKLLKILVDKKHLFV